MGNLARLSTRRSLWTRWASALALSLCLIACKSRTPRGLSEASALGNGGATATGAGPEAGGAGVLTGSADGTPFTNAAAFVIESPDVEATTVIYVLSRPVRCVDLSFSEWDKRLPGETTFLELKFSGHAPGTFWAVETDVPSPGQVVATYSRPSAGGASDDIRSTGGTVTLATIAPRDAASVSFSMAFGSHQMTGNLTALFCPGGHQP